MDIFNLFNGNTSLSIRGRQNTGTRQPGNANQISSIWRRAFSVRFPDVVGDGK
jgi:hypothetical protein